MLPYILVSLLLIIIYFIIVLKEYEIAGKEKIVSIDMLTEKVQAIIVLGAGINEDGSPSDILRHRLDKGIELFEKGVAEKILLSGGIKGNSNEIKCMKDYLLNYSDIRIEYIVLDPLGTNTFQSIYRAKKYFDFNDIIIVTNKYHLPRALLIAENFELTAIGIISDKGEYENMDYYEFREKIAQIKDNIKLSIKN